MSYHPAQNGQDLVTPVGRDFRPEPVQVYGRICRRGGNRDSLVSAMGHLLGPILVDAGTSGPSSRVPTPTLSADFPFYHNYQLSG